MAWAVFCLSMGAIAGAMLVAIGVIWYDIATDKKSEPVVEPAPVEQTETRFDWEYEEYVFFGPNKKTLGEWDPLELDHIYRINNDVTITIPNRVCPLQYYNWTDETYQRGINGHSVWQFPITELYLLQDVCAYYGVDPLEILSIIYRESGFETFIKNKQSSAYGYMQLLKGWDGNGNSPLFTMTDRTSPLENLCFGIYLYHKDPRHFGGRIAVNPVIKNALQLEWPDPELLH